MEPIRYVDRLNKFYSSQGFPPYDWTINEEAPLTQLTKPLAECRVSMLTAGGVSRCAAAPWNPNARNDLRLDEITSDAPSDDFQIHDAYYDHGDADRDLNCLFPIDRLHELAADGVIKEVASRFWSGFMGRIYKRTTVIEETAPALAARLREDGVDLFVLVPA
jgi:D-proline reductase (dithiol) PrdB